MGNLNFLMNNLTNKKIPKGTFNVEVIKDENDNR